MSALAPQVDAAITFLELKAPGGPWAMTAISPDSPATTTETFYKADAAARWIERENASRNIYLMAAEPAGVLRKKASKEDVARSRHLWADIDGDGDLRQRLNGGVPPPSMVVASGGGFNVWWVLGSPLEDIAEIEARNRWLAEHLGADHCWNADRILRLPGTVNWPNAKKRRAGREPVLARCVEFHPDRIYSPGDFGRVEPEAARERVKADLGGDVRPLTLADLPAEVREKLPAWARRLIVDGPAADEYHGDRSKAVMAVACAMIRAEASDGQIAGILLNPDLPIHDHIRDQKGHGPRAYVARQIERARDRAADDAAATKHGAAVAENMLGGPQEQAAPWHENIRPIAWPSLTGRYAPPRRFVAKGWIPYGCVTSLYGTGGIGKSMAAQLLGTAAALGRHWLGVETERCRVLALHCEDDEHELWRRQERINAAFGITMDDLADFMPDARTGLENILAHGRDVLQPAELYDQLAAAIAELKPGLVILDNIAQLYGAAENDRALVTQFVNYLARLARDGDCAVVLLGHVAKAEGSEYSGSTAWDAAVRSRLLLAYEGQGDEKRLLLRKPKANYAETDAIELEWRDGLLCPVNHFDDSPGGKLERGLRDGQANQVFLDALDTLRARGMAASESPKAATTYAPRLIAAQGLAGEFTTRDMKLAMDRLFKDGRIKASMAVVKAANRHTKTGIGRVEWEWAAPHTDAPNGACAAHAPDTCAALHRVPLTGTLCSAHLESLGASQIPPENMCSASEAQMCDAPPPPDADGWEEV